jgi:predicted phage tail protein
MRLKIILHGALRNLQRDPVEIEAKTPLEALKTYFTQAKQFAPTPGNLPWRVKVAGFEDIGALSSPTEKTELHVVPDFDVSGKSPLIAIGIGIVFIAASFIPGLNAAVWAGGPTIASIVLGIGVSIALGGLMQLISPAPSAVTSSGSNATGDPAASKYLGAPKNTVAIGTRISILVGRYLGAGQYLSFDIQAMDVAV